MLAAATGVRFAPPVDVGGNAQHRGSHVDAGGRWRRPSRACVSDAARTDRPRPSERRRHPRPSETALGLGKKGPQEGRRFAEGTRRALRAWFE